MGSVYLGVDYGSRRVGLALADSQTNLARPLKTIKNSSHLIDEIKQIVAAEGVTAIVVGRPRDEDGNSTPQSEAVELWASDLRSLGLPVVLQDEFDTSNLAASRIGAHNKEMIDQEAAAIILQDYLDLL